MSQSFDTDSNRWVALHEHLQDLLAGYVDQELNSEQAAMVEAHLAGCEACRNDLARQQLLSARLKTLPPPRLSARFNQTLDQALADDVPPGKSIHRRRLWPLAASALNGFQQVNRPVLPGASGWIVALVLVVVMLGQFRVPTDNTPIPMVRDVVMEYREMNDRPIPVSAENAATKPPVSWPNSHLLATWETKIGGAPARAFAVRSGKDIVFQYRINESVFFRNPAVRQAVHESGNYRTRTWNTDVIAVPLTNAGLLIVGPADSLPAPEQLRFKPT